VRVIERRVPCCRRYPLACRENVVQFDHVMDYRLSGVRCRGGRGKSTYPEGVACDEYFYDR